MSDEKTRLIRLPEVLHLTGLGRSNVYAMAKNGSFPAVIKLGKKCSAWEEASVRRWISERVTAAKPAS